MFGSYLGIYWPANCALTLRQYADATRSFLTLLRRLHPVFQALEWVGDGANSTVHLSPDLCNLNDLIYRHAGRDDAIYQDKNPDGTLSWASVGKFGYGMVYETGKSAEASGVSIRIKAGCYGIPTPNAIWLGFPLTSDVNFPYREFYKYEFLMTLFTKMIEFWKPANGLVTTHPFSNAITDDAPPYVGWLTYLHAPRAAALRNDLTLHDLIFEQLPDGGTLISLGTDIISPDNLVQVTKARRLRSRLLAEGFF